MNWINIEDKLPEFNTPILIKFIKDKQGEIITQGYYQDKAQEIASQKAKELSEIDDERIKKMFKSTTERDYWVKQSYGLCWFNYSGIKIQNLDKKVSKNKVIAWMEIPK